MTDIKLKYLRWKVKSTENKDKIYVVTYISIPRWIVTKYLTNMTPVYDTDKNIIKFEAENKEN